MSRIAAPRYVGTPADCPPGHRFNLYCPLWSADWTIGKGAKFEALTHASLMAEGRELLEALRCRQLELARTLLADRVRIVEAMATAPFVTGLGNEHPIENGFAFLTPYGLPYLAGSGVKGVLRRAAEELLLAPTPGFEQSVIDALFGPEDPAADGSGPPLPESRRRRGALACWDVFPALAGDKLGVDVLTPHAGEYYAGKESPHDAGQPIPAPFLSVPEGSAFRFVVTFEPSLWPNGESAPDWRALVDAAFDRAFIWLGFGAKTAVGYGAMVRSTSSGSPREKEAAAVAAPSAALTPAVTFGWSNCKLTWDPGRAELVAIGPDKERSLPIRGKDAARAVFHPPEAFERLVKKRELQAAQVECGREGRQVIIIRVIVSQ